MGGGGGAAFAGCWEDPDFGPTPSPAGLARAVLLSAWVAAIAQHCGAAGEGGQAEVSFSAGMALLTERLDRAAAEAAVLQRRQGQADRERATRLERRR